MRKILLKFLLVFATLFTTTWATNNPRAVIVFDASGSMWGQINGKAKIEIAKDALKNVVKSWNPNIELGLTVYGHRRKGDCNDIQSVVPVGAVDKGRIIKSVMAISPKGKTPISRSLRKVAKELRFTEDKATIILISDGKETCDPDPCGTAKELKKEGIDFITHVIGFNVDKTTDRQLQCIANATGGEYFSAKNATALNKAIKKVVKKVVVAPKPKVKKLTHNLEITASETKGGKWVESRIGDAVNAEGKSANIVTYGTYKNRTNNSLLPVGKYNLIDATYSGYKIDKVPFEIKKGEITKLNIVFGQTGQVAITASETKGGKWVSARIGNAVNTEGENVDIGTYATYKNKENIARLPVGKYNLTDVTYSGYKIDKVPFEVKAGEITKLNIVFGQTGQVAITASETKGGKWVSARIGNAVNTEGENVDIGTYATYKNKENIARLPVGKYNLTDVTYSGYKIDKVPFEVKAGEITKLDIVFSQTGKVYATARESEGGKLIDASCLLYNEDKSDNWSLSMYKKNPQEHTRQIPAGKYTANCSYNAFKRKDIPVEVKAGETVHFDVVFGQTGKVYATARESEGGKLIDASCLLYNEDKSDNWSLSIYKKNPQEHTRQIPAGKYTANCSYNAFKRKDIPVEVKAGETVHFDVVFPYFYLESKCVNPSDRVSYEVYAKSGELAYDNSVACSKKLKVTLNEGEYSIEGKAKDTKAVAKVEISTKEPQSAVLDFTKQNHEAEIKADTPTQDSKPAQKPTNSGSKTIKIGDKVINIEGLSDEQIKKLKDMQKMLEMFGKK